MCSFFFFFQAEDGIRDSSVTGVQTCALPICICTISFVYWLCWTFSFHKRYGADTARLHHNFFGGRLYYLDESGESSAVAPVIFVCSSYTPRYSGGSIESMLRLTWSLISSIYSPLIFVPPCFKTMEL